MNAKVICFQKHIFFIAGSVVMMCMTLSSYGIATVTPRLLAEFNAMEYYTLTGLMASVGMLVFLPVAGKLTDTVGRKPLLLIGGGITLFSSIAAAFAPNFISFVILRGLITVGSAFLSPIPSATLPFIYESEELPKLYGLQTAFLALGTFFGSSAAGLCSDMGMTWLAVVYPGILTALAVAVMVAFCPTVERKPLPGIDFPGIVFLLLIITPVMIISGLGPLLGWGSPIMLGAYMVLTAASFLFFHTEKKAAQPLVNLKLFTNKVFTGTLLCTFLLVWYQTSMRNYIPLAVQNVMGQSAMASGMVGLPRSILNVIVPFFCGTWIAKNQKSRCWKGLFLAGALIAAGNILLCLVSPASSLILIYAGLGLTGIAESLKGAAQMPALQSGIPRSEMGSAVSLGSMMGSLGSAVSAAVLGALHTSICGDGSVLETLNRANHAVFFGAGISGILVCFFAFLFVRKMNTN